MSFELINSAWPTVTGSHVTKLILIALADHADASGRCFPSIARLMERTELRRTAIITGLKSLEAGGFITIERANGHGSKYVVNRYARRTGAPDVPVCQTDGTSTPDVPHRYARRTRNHKEPSHKHQRATKVPKAPKQDLAFEAIATLHGGHKGMTDSCRGIVNRALGEIRESCKATGTELTAEEVQRRIGHLRIKFDGFANGVSAKNLARDWVLLANPPAGKNGHPSRETAEAELRRMRHADMLEAKDPAFQARKRELEALLGQKP